MKIISLLILVLLAGCGGESTPVSGGSVAAPSLEGKRFSGCYQKDGANRIDEIRVSPQEYEFVSTAFQREKCGIPEVSQRVISQIDANSPTNAARTIYTLDLAVKSVELVVHDEATVIQFNSRAVCGFKDWERWKYKDVSGKDCVGMALPKVGDREYTVYQLRADDSLYLGLPSPEADGKSSEKRPRRFDESRHFVRAAS